MFKFHGGLKPVYTVCGDEPFLVEEAAAQVRAAAREDGFDTREVMHVDRTFDWQALAASAASMSLFGSRRLIELRIPNANPGVAGSRALVEYCDRPPEDTVLLVIAGKPDGGRRAKWVTALQAAGPFEMCRQVPLKDLGPWIVARMRAKGLQPHPDAVELIAQRVEGNLLAAAQEIDKLVLLHGSGPVDLAAVREAVSDSARYDLFQWVDSAVAGDSARALRMLDGLRAEGTEPVLMLWAIVRELRTLVSVVSSVARGESLDRAMYSARIWESRKATVRSGAARMRPARVKRLLARAALTDRIVKGMAPGSAWDELAYLTVGLAGRSR